LRNRADAPDLLLRLLRSSGGGLIAHLLLDLQGQLLGLFVCKDLLKALETLKTAGLTPETEPVVLVTTENRDGALHHLMRTLSRAGVEVRCSQSATQGSELTVVFRVNNVEAAETALANYLLA
jgi:hypothetical protein